MANEKNSVGEKEKAAAFNVRLSKKDKEILDVVISKAGLSQAGFLKHCIQLYETGGMAALGFEGQTIKPNTLNPEQTAVLEQAVAITGGSIEDFMIDASMSRAEQVTKLSSYTTEELKKVPNSANIKIHRAVVDLIEKNKLAKEWYEKVEVTQGKIFEATGSNRAAIRKYFAENVAMIEEHNKGLNIEPNHNTKAAVHLLQMAKKANKEAQNNG
jgi:hypothetical protein